MIRPAQPTDAGSVGAILSEFIDCTDWMPRLYSRAQELGFAGVMIDRGWVSVFVTQDRAIAGFLARDDSFIHALYVRRRWQGQGIGRALLDHAKDHAATLVLQTFQANAAAQQFYASQGFRVAGQGDGSQNDEGLPDLRLIWEKDTA